VTAAPPAGPASAPVTAGIVTRGLAATVDFLVTIVALGGVYLGLTIVRFVISPRNFHAVRPPTGASVAVWFGLAVIYLTVSWVATGRTLGAQLLGLRVTGRAGAAVRPAVALLRAILYIAFPIGLLWSAANRRNASLQDLLLGTAVVYDWQVHAPPTSRAGAPGGVRVGAAPPTTGG
jgi:uncharacterized RDD family membrane protein YckC